MRTRSKLVLAGLAATLLMAFAVGSATASHLSISNQSFRAVWNPLRFFGEGGAAAEVRCPVTIEGTFHSATIAKTIGSLIGYVTRASVGNGSCTGGHMTILQASLPWHVTYEGFEGTLPRITGIRLLFRNFAFLLELGAGTSCLYAENGTSQFEGTANISATGVITGLQVNTAIRLPLRSGLFCPPEVGFEGTGTVTLLGNTNSITVRLI